MATKDLQGAQASTLVWSLDDVLRYVPLAALYDGNQYLVERYRNVVITTASVGNLKDPPQVSSWRGLAMGVSKDYDGLGPLKTVARFGCFATDFPSPLWGFSGYGAPGDRRWFGRL